ncbi:heterokaryon incompatibility protein [Diplodia corticola]|uniref:Heterokaryon incompatibility protein n=1 Tax=Diplodia corticola TaxID=236234 RepID=A0A1J9S7T1_9PEZI|nr:heterokaryon incompatibility protein [Diplodia corticola]OJD35645.1 heterokaryon incompatibility protein [Diplodia corticola]
MGPNCEHEHHATLSELRACGTCELCILINILICEDTGTTAKKDSAYRIQLVNDGSKPHRYLKFSFRQECGRWTDKKMIIACWESLTDDVYEGFRSLGPSTASKQTFDLVGSWLDECLAEHTACNHISDLSSRLPTRLVEIEAADVNGGCIRARLCCGESLPPGTPYVTLSHCWGKDLFTTLTTKNEVDWMQSLPTEDLPQTFRDAMAIARKLRYRYLWVDSLCIVQDSEEDWMREASRMSEVYQHSDLTISATASKRASDGCFHSRPPYLFRHHGRPSSGIPPSFWSLAPRDLWDLGVESRRKLGLPRRAWVLQERLLSRRILHYSSLGVFWECDKVRRSELVPDHSTPRQFAGLLQQLSASSHETPASEWHRHWAALVKDYSERQLTYPDRDKLAALSGVAKAFQSQLDDEAYVAGMWNDKDDLLRMLMWTAIKKAPRQAKPVYRAPSWSWASLDTAVSPPLSSYGHDLVSFVNIKHAQTRPFNPADPTGRVVDGSVTVVGFCVPTLLTLDKQKTRLKLVGRHTASAQKFWQQYRPTVRMDHVEPISSFPRWLWCIPWFSYDFMTRDNKPRHRISFLLLESARPGEQKPKTFRRAGMAESWSFPLAYKWDLIYYREVTVV